MRTKSSQCLNFPKIIDLLNGIEVVLHALDGNVFASLDALGFEDFGEGTLSFL
jgi:hypothetical protein